MPTCVHVYRRACVLFARQAPLLVTVLLFLFVASLAYAQNSSQNPDRTPKADGLGYYLPKHVMLLETTITTEIRRRAREQRSAAGACDSDAPPYPLVKPTVAQNPVTKPPGGEQAAPAPATPVIPIPEGKLCIEETVVTTRAVNAQLKVVADVASGVQTLSVPGKTFADVKLSVELRDGTLLKGLNVASNGRAGDVLVVV